MELSSSDNIIEVLIANLKGLHRIFQFLNRTQIFALFCFVFDFCCCFFVLLFVCFRFSTFACVFVLVQGLTKGDDFISLLYVT